MKKNALRILFPSLLLVLASCLETTATHTHLYGPYHYENESYHERVCPECPESESGHKEEAEHHWDEGRITLEPTHLSEGEKTYTCLACGGTKKEAVPKTTEHTFNQRSTDPQYLKEAATCQHKAIYYYSCICGEKGSETFESGLPLAHKITSFSLVSDNTKKDYHAFETFDLTGLKLKFTCEVCGEHEVDAKDVMVKYQSGANSFRFGDTSLTLLYGGKSIPLNGFHITKAPNQILGMKDLNIHCHDALDLSSIHAENGEVTIKIVDKNQKEVTDYASLDETNSPYTLFASVEASKNIDGATAQTQITVHHQSVYRASKEEDVCACGVKALDNYYYNVQTKEIDTSDIAGMEKNSWSKDIEVLDASTGTAPDFSNMKSGETKKLITTLNGKTIHFRALGVDFILKTNEQFKKFVEDREYAKWDEQNKPIKYYIVLGADFRGLSTHLTVNNSVNKTDKVYFQSHVFDGRGHTLYDPDIQGYGLFGDPSNSSIIKNLNIVDLECGPWAGNEPTNSSSFENINVYLKPGITKLKYGNTGVFANSIQLNVAFNNVYLDCKDLEEGYAIAPMDKTHGTPYPVRYNNMTIRCKKTLNAYGTTGVERPTKINWIDVD